MKKSIVVMAAGMGSRFGGLKQLNKFGQEKKVLLDYAIEDALSAGFEKIVFVIRKDIEKIFRDEVSQKYENILDVRYAFQELSSLPNGYISPSGRTKPWGTAHAVLVSKDFVKEPFLAINADDYYGKSIYSEMGNFLDENEKDFSLAGYKLKNTLSKNGGVSRGVCESDSNGYLKTVIEFSNLEQKENSISSKEGKVFSGEEFVSLNFWGLRPIIFDVIEKYFSEFLDNKINEDKSELYLPYVIDRAIKENLIRAKIIPTNEIWQGVTYREDIESVEEFLKYRK